MEAVPWDHLDKIGTVGVALLLVLGFVREWIVAGPAHRRELAAAKEEAHTWRTAFFSEQEMRRDLEQTGRIVRTTFQALPPPEDSS